MAPHPCVGQFCCTIVSFLLFLSLWSVEHVCFLYNVTLADMHAAHVGMESSFHVKAKLSTFMDVPLSVVFESVKKKTGGLVSSLS